MNCPVLSKMKIVALAMLVVPATLFAGIIVPAEIDFDDIRYELTNQYTQDGKEIYDYFPLRNNNALKVTYFSFAVLKNLENIDEVTFRNLALGKLPGRKDSIYYNVSYMPNKNAKLLVLNQILAPDGNDPSYLSMVSIGYFSSDCDEAAILSIKSHVNPESVGSNNQERLAYVTQDNVLTSRMLDLWGWVPKCRMDKKSIMARKKLLKDIRAKRKYVPNTREALAKPKNKKPYSEYTGENAQDPLYSDDENAVYALKDEVVTLDAPGSKTADATISATDLSKYERPIKVDTSLSGSQKLNSTGKIEIFTAKDGFVTMDRKSSNVDELRRAGMDEANVTQKDSDGAGASGNVVADPEKRLPSPTPSGNDGRNVDQNGKKAAGDVVVLKPDDASSGKVEGEDAPDSKDGKKIIPAPKPRKRPDLDSLPKYIVF